MRPTDLGFLRLLTDEVPMTLDLGEVSESLPTRFELEEDRRHLLIWHSPHVWLRLGGPDAELRKVARKLRKQDIHIASGHRFGIRVSGNDLCAVWPLDANGLARWELRAGVIGQGRFGWAKRLLIQMFGDRVIARTRPGTLVRVGCRHAR